MSKLYSPEFLLIALVALCWCVTTKIVMHMAYFHLFQKYPKHIKKKKKFLHDLHIPFHPLPFINAQT